MDGYLVGVLDGGEGDPVAAHQAVPEHALVPQLHDETRVHAHRLTATQKERTIQREKEREKIVPMIPVVMHCLTGIPKY